MSTVIRVPRRPAAPVAEPAAGSTDSLPDPQRVSAPDSIAGDVLEGAAEIAAFMFGDRAHARRAHTAIARGLPVFRVGNRLFARRSRLLAWISSQEERRN